MGLAGVETIDADRAPEANSEKTTPGASYCRLGTEIRLPTWAVCDRACISRHVVMGSRRRWSIEHDTDCPLVTQKLFKVLATRPA